MFITFEGVEGSGKSTAVCGVARRLAARGCEVLVTREPGGSELGRELRQLLLGTTQDLDPMAELCLFLADRAQHVAKVIRPSLAKGIVVLCDRYADSTMAYQGWGRGLDKEAIATLNAIACHGLVPDLTLVLDVPVEEGLRRVARRNADGSGVAEGRIDRETVSFHKAVREGFLSLSRQEPKRVRLIDSGPPREEVLEVCMREIDALWADRFPD